MASPAVFEQLLTARKRGAMVAVSVAVLSIVIYVVGSLIRIETGFLSLRTPF